MPLIECYTSTGAPSDCNHEISAVHIDASDRLRDAVEEVASPNVRFVETDSLFCTEGICPGQVDGVVVLVDDRHVTDAYADYIGPALGELLDID